MSENEFNNSFKHNFYLTEEWATFCSQATGIPVIEKTFLKKKIFLLNKKNIGISNYTNSLSKEFCENKIAHMRVLPKINKNDKTPSFVEYAILFKDTYENAIKKYKRTHKAALKQGRKYPHKLEIVKEYKPKIIDELYVVYKKHMKRLNSTFFPKFFFVSLMNSPSSLVFILRYKQKIISYSFCFQYKDNLYASIGGGDADYFKIKCVNKLYDELIKYSCDNNLNLHLGMGEKDMGFNLFKENCGAINFKCERYPNNEEMIKKITPYLKLKITGFILGILSKLFPKKVVYMVMPFT